MRPISRREVLRGAGAATVAGFGATSALAQGASDWPNKPVRFVVNFGAGGSSDSAARTFAEQLAKVLPQRFVVENRSGASGVIGAESVIKSAPDGYTFLATPGLTMVILPHLRTISFDPLKDMVPVAVFAEGMQLIAVHPTVPVNTLQELIAYAKANPGKLSWGTAGVGSYGHMVCETFKNLTGTDILHVPYRGTGDAMADFLAGVHQIQADPVTLQHVIAGKAKMLAVLDRNRRPDFPDVPTLKEIIPEMDSIVWFGLFAPPGTPEPIINKVADEIAKAASLPEVKEVLFKLSMSPYPGTRADGVELIKSDYERYGKWIRQFGIKAE